MHASAPPSAVILDNDGLLLDTESVWTRGEKDLYARRAVEFTLAAKQELVGTSAEVAAEVIARHLGEEGREAALIAELDELVLAELEEGVEPMPGAIELLDGVRSAGIPLALVSNSPPRFIARALELVGLTEVFDAIVSGHEVAAPKPAPDAYLEACRQLGVEPGPEVVVLEDSPTGVAAAKAAGLAVIGVPSLPGVELDEADATAASLRDPRIREAAGISPRSS